MKKTVQFSVNDKPVKLEAEADQSLLWLLRGDMELTGTKYGCGVGLCGACTVLVDGIAQRACMLPVQSIANKKVTTIEGLAQGEVLHPVQQAFVDHDALQCGYCTPGMILSAVSLLAENPEASDEEIAVGLDDNLCRCGAHQRIVKAVRSVANKPKA